MTRKDLRLAWRHHLSPQDSWAKILDGSVSCGSGFVRWTDRLHGDDLGGSAVSEVDF